MSSLPFEDTGSTSVTLQSGQLIGGRYTITDVIGKGGMGMVVEAVHTGTKGKVAIKVMSERIGGELLARFQREARASGAVDSPHIIRIFDTGIDEATNTPYMVMERLHGEDLSAVIQRVGSLPPDVALRVVAQALKGLVKAHAAGIVHRDIKPANLFVADMGLGEATVKILDFGIAKLTVDALTDMDTGLTQTGSVIGSPQYMSPEQAQGIREIDHRTDLWSMGVVLFKALSGQTPHQESSFGRIILSICSKPIRDVRDYAPWVPEDISAIVRRATMIAPTKRFQSAAEMLEAVTAAQQKPAQLTLLSLVPVSDALRGSSPHIPVQPRLPSIADLEDSNATLGTQSVDVAPTQMLPRTPRRTRAVVISLVAASALLGAGLAVVQSPAKQAGSAAASPRVSEPAAHAVTTATPSTSASSASSAATTLHGRLRIEPRNAQVTLDGVATPLSDGAIEVMGPADSTHFVKIASGKGEPVLREVTLRANGEVSPDVVRASSAAPVLGSAPSGHARPSAATSASAEGAATAQPKPASSALQVKNTLE